MHNEHDANHILVENNQEAERVAEWAARERRHAARIRARDALDAARIAMQPKPLNFLQRFIKGAFHGYNQHV